MAQIISDNHEIQSEIEKQIALVKEHGGWVHPDLLIRIDQGDLSMEMPEGSDPQAVILNVPLALFVPVDQFNIWVEGERFHYSFPEDCTLPAIKREMAARIFNLYNLTNKVRNFKRDSAWLMMAEAPEIMKQITRGRTLIPHHKKWHKLLSEKPDETALNELICRSFLKTRVFGAVAFNAEKKLEQRETLMPLIDILNHHAGGAGFKVEIHGSRRCMAMRNRQAVAGRKECFAVYGIIDALDSFLRYDFIDAEAPYVRSVPMTLAVGDFGTIEAQSLPGAVHKGKVPAGLRDLKSVLPVIQKNEKHDSGAANINISHLLIPATQASPHALRRVLAWLVGMVADGRAKPEALTKIVIALEEEIISANRTFYDDLSARVQTLADDMRIKKNLDRLVSLQLAKLDEYQLMHAVAA